MRGRAGCRDADRARPVGGRPATRARRCRPDALYHRNAVSATLAGRGTSPMSEASASGGWRRRDGRRRHRARDRRNGTRAGSFAAARRHCGEDDQSENQAAGIPVCHPAGHVIRRRTLVLLRQTVLPWRDRRGAVRAVVAVVRAIGAYRRVRHAARTQGRVEVQQLHAPCTRATCSHTAATALVRAASSRIAGVALPPTTSFAP